MKKIYNLLFLLPFCMFSQQQTVTSSIAPSAFEENQQITVTINGSSVNKKIMDGNNAIIKLKVSAPARITNWSWLTPLRNVVIISYNGMPAKPKKLCCFVQLMTAWLTGLVIKKLISIIIV